MKERIAQHRHCRTCGKAFVGDDPYCGVECSGASKDKLAKKKRQLLILYAISFVILMAVLLVGLR
jgi:predicted nucleic acid-binding Zn ribbon protein